MHEETIGIDPEFVTCVESIQEFPVDDNIFTSLGIGFFSIRGLVTPSPLHLDRNLI